MYERPVPQALPECSSVQGDLYRYEFPVPRIPQAVSPIIPTTEALLAGIYNNPNVREPHHRSRVPSRHTLPGTFLLLHPLAAYSKLSRCLIDTPLRSSITVLISSSVAMAYDPPLPPDVPSTRQVKHPSALIRSGHSTGRISMGSAVLYAYKYERDGAFSGAFTGSRGRIDPGSMRYVDFRGHDHYVDCMESKGWRDWLTLPPRAPPYRPPRPATCQGEKQSKHI